MSANYSLSPCVESALRALPENITSWDLAKHLLEMHPEYTHGKTRSVSSLLEEIKTKYPNESFFHTQFVILALYYLDPELNKLLPKDIISIIEKAIWQ